MRLALVIALLLFIPAKAATYTAASPSWIDVSNALASCSSAGGDVVQIPAGAALWTNVLQIPNGVQIIGSGTNSTHITNGVRIASPWGSGTVRPPLFWVTHTNQNHLTRISQMHVVCNQYAGTAGWTNAGAWTNNLGVVYADPANRNTNAVLSQFVFDQNFVEFAYSRAIYTDGAVYGVVSSNVFRDCFLVIEPTDRNNVGWNRTWNAPPLLAMGTTNVLVCEDNVTIHTDVGAAWDGTGGSGGWGPTFGTACGQGGAYVWRFNLVTNTANTRLEGHDLHGNNEYIYPPVNWRGSIFCEIYGNRYYSPTNGRGPRWCHMRGGTSMLYSNTVTIIGIPNASFDDIQMGEEEYTISKAFEYPETGNVRTNPPGFDQVTNSFWFANYRSDGTPFTRLHNPLSSSNCVVLGTDFWTNAPWETNTFTFTNRSGSVNVMAGYRPLAYPHPLLSALSGGGGGGTPPTPGVSALNAGVANIGSIIYVGP